MNSSSDWFRDWFDSPYYPPLYADHDEREAAAFIDRLLAMLAPSASSRVLDLACGRGRHALVLAEKGFDVTGIDLSARSIAYARQFEKENLHFYQHDMRQSFYIRYFDYVFNFFTSFGYFRTRRENENTVRTVGGSLKPGGVFVLDYLNTPYAEAHLVPRSRKEVGDVVYTLTRWSDEQHFYKRIDIEDRNNPQPVSYTEKVAKFTVADFTRMCAAYGLRVQGVFGNYELDAYDTVHSPRLLLVAKKEG